MSSDTKAALAQALTQRMHRQPFNEITIQELASDCGISRTAFYYHFKDIYDLLEWMFHNAVAHSFDECSRTADWVTVLQGYYETIYRDRELFLNVYHSVGNVYLWDTLYPVTRRVLTQVIDMTRAAYPNVSDEDRTFIVDFYSHGFVGIIMKWIERGLDADYENLARQAACTVNGTIKNSLSNFAGSPS